MRRLRQTNDHTASARSDIRQSVDTSSDGVNIILAGSANPIMCRQPFPDHPRKLRYCKWAAFLRLTKETHPSDNTSHEPPTRTSHPQTALTVINQKSSSHKIHQNIHIVNIIRMPNPQRGHGVLPVRPANSQDDDDSDANPTTT